MKTLARWCALAAVAASLVAGGDGRQTPVLAQDATEGDEADLPRSGWRNWLPALLQPAAESPDTPTHPPVTPPTTPPPTTTDPEEPVDPVVEPPNPCLPPPLPEARPPLPAIGTVEEEQSRFFKAVGEELIAPGYASFATTTQALATAASDYCGSTGNADDAPLRAAWQCAMTAWQRAQHFRTGPVEQDNRRLRIQFYPDGNRAVVRNLDALLDGTETITEALVRNTAAGAQGFPALERLIFADALSPGSRRCEAAVAIAANLRTMAEEIATPWQAGGALLPAFENGTDPFLDRNDALVAVLEAIAVQGEFVADQKIRRALRTEDASLLESPFAGHSKENIAANVDALAALVHDDQAGAYRLRHYLLRAHDERDVGDQLAAAAAQAQARIAAVAGSFETAVGQPSSADGERLQGLFEDFQRLSALAEEAAIAAGVNLGFNSEDGD